MIARDGGESGAYLARVGGGLGTFQHEPESFGRSDLSSVRSDVEVAGIEWSCAGAGGLAGKGRNTCRQEQQQRRLPSE